MHGQYIKGPVGIGQALAIGTGSTPQLILIFFLVHTLLLCTVLVRSIISA